MKLLSTHVNVDVVRLLGSNVSVSYSYDCTIFGSGLYCLLIRLSDMVSGVMYSDDMFHHSNSLGVSCSCFAAVDKLPLNRIIILYGVSVLRLNA